MKTDTIINELMILHRWRAHRDDMGNRLLSYIGPWELFEGIELGVEPAIRQIIFLGDNRPDMDYDTRLKIYPEAQRAYDGRVLMQCSE